MRPPTKQELVDENRRIKQEASILFLALGCLAGGDVPDAEEWADEPGGEFRYQFRLYGATRADGGIVVVTYHHPQQRPGTTAHYLEDMDQLWRAGDASTLPLRCAFDRLRVARNRILFSQAESEQPAR